LCLSLFAERIDVAAGCEKNRQLVFSLHTQTVDGDIGARLGVAAQHQAETEIGAGILLGVGGRR
jgi:hypothetical protein